MKATISSKGQIVLPAEFRQMDRIEPGQEFEVERLDPLPLPRTPEPQAEALFEAEPGVGGLRSADGRVR